jgi:short-subunit dehydrogenase
MDSKKQDVKGPYAIVTGAGAGMGAAFASELASRGYDIIMVSLPGEDLMAKSARLAALHPVDVRYYECDLSEESSCIALHQWVKQEGFTVTVLINNAGIGSTHPFLDFDPGFYTRQLRVNVVAPVILCRMLIPDMLATQRPCHILNMGSLGGYFHIPNKEVYGASKAFVHSFTHSLQLRLKGSNISLMLLCPGAVNTNERLRDAHKDMKGLAKRSLMLPDEVAAIAVNALLKGRKVLVPGKINNLFLALDRIFPEFVKNRIILKEMKRQSSFTR